MLVSLRTYRSIAACLAAVLLLNGVLPLVGHACAFLGHDMEATAQHPCCDEQAHDAMPANAPCAHAPAPAPHPHEAVPGGRTEHAQHNPSPMPGDCCAITPAQTPLRDQQLLTKHTPRLDLQPAVLVPTHPTPTGLPARTLSLPVEAATAHAPPLALYLLNGSFLN